MDDNLIFQSVNLYNFDPLSLFREEVSTQHSRLSENWEESPNSPSRMFLFSLLVSVSISTSWFNNLVVCTATADRGVEKLKIPIIDANLIKTKTIKRNKAKRRAHSV